MHDFRYPLFGAAAAAMVWPMPLVAEQPALPTFESHHAGVLGTAMDLTVVAPTQADVTAVEKVILDEIERLRKILSAYEPDADLARLNASPVNGPGISASVELIDVLRKYEEWFKRTSGAYNGHAGDLINLWKQAEADKRLPSDAVLLAAANRCKAPAWEINEAAKTVRRISDQQINIDSLGKGYIIDKALAVATGKPEKVKGILLNIGGDIRTWGTPTGKPDALWAIGIQNPDDTALNAKPLTTVYIPGGKSICTSGAYQRYYTIDGKRYSHILDARTGKAARNPSATVIAADSATANALATSCSAMKVTEAFQLVRAMPGAEFLIVTADGTQVRTDGFKELQDAASAKEKFAATQPSQFPTGYKLSVDLETTATERKPYVFVWVTDSKGKHVKTLAAFGNETKWLAEMREWWKLAKDNRALRSITRATQRAGKYPVQWDGTDQRGNGVPLGTYKLWVEVAAEHGPYACKSATITLGRESTTATINKSAAFAEVKITYGGK